MAYDSAQKLTDMSGVGSVRKKLGVIGGMGPAATAYFYELLTGLADVGTDQEHLEVFIISRPSVPDRTAYITGKSIESPVAPIIEAGRALTSLGAGLIAIPCVTAHYFFDELERGIGAPIIHMIKETAERLMIAGVRAAGVMAADGTVFGGILSNELESRGIRAVLPSPHMQERVMELIYDSVKANRPFDIDLFLSVSDELTEKGAGAVVLACTELSLIKRDSGLSGYYVDMLEVLARRALELCGIPLRGSWTQMIRA